MTQETIHNKTNEPTVWDVAVQTFHGGQEWGFIDNFVEDYSVTTNPLGTPQLALEKAKESLSLVHHYPSADGEPAKSALAQFLSGDRPYAALCRRLILGNGASELIDLCIGLCPGTTFRQGPSTPQYQEYVRAAINHNKKEVPFHGPPADLLCVVNPCNPTGMFLKLCDVKRGIEQDWNVPEGSTVIVDESMQPWIGPHWRTESLTQEGDWIERMANEKHIDIFVIHSWTKLWSCPGLRTGSIVCPTVPKKQRLVQHQVPWSVNTGALAFLTEVVKDTEYLKKTWLITSQWRSEICRQLQKDHKDWDIFGEPFLSYIWIDVKNEKVAQRCVQRCREGGVPIRWGAYGYNSPTCIRIAVRSPATVSREWVTMNKSGSPNWYNNGTGLLGVRLWSF